MMYVRCFTNSKWLTKIKTQDNVFIKWRVFSLPQTVYSRHQHAQNVSLLGMMKHWVPRILGLHGRVCSIGTLILEKKLHSSAC